LDDDLLVLAGPAKRDRTSGLTCAHSLRWKTHHLLPADSVDELEEEFPAPTARDLGISSDPNQKLPVTVVVTDDHKVYFCRSGLNPADYIIWVRAADNDSSYLFLFDSGLKLIRVVHLKTAAFPEVSDVLTAQIQAIYNNALVALGKDVDHAH
jgi:hypothetical protein